MVGYGKQKKEGVVASVTQTTGKVLERAGGVSSIGAALTGNVPGLITNASTGLPGAEDPQIIIRGRSTWNNSDPLILVDGVERPMNSVDISSVETVTVLKDASATAVFGSRGANGVILITTKRGKTGKASIRATVNTILKSPSKLPGKYDSFDALRIRNDVIEYELATKPDGWRDYLPFDILNKYRNPADLAEAERYPNVNWEETLFKSHAWSNNANLNISGGTNTVKYFTSADFLHEADLFKTYNNKRGYEQGFGFDRLNVRSNLDFQLTPSTLFKTNLSGSYGVRKSPWGFSGSEYGSWIDAYNAAPDLFLPVYSDGSWGYYAPNEARAENSARSLAIGGVSYQTTARITTDFTLDQELDMITKGLRFTGTISLDNTFVESDRGINDLYNDTQRKWINPETGAVTYRQAIDGITGFDFQEGIKWNPAAGTIGASQRRLFYQLQLNYAKNIAGKHYVTGMGLMNRNVFANGSMIPSYREDWVFRTTYTYNNKYTVEYNGAYNGSEQFASAYRFAFFQSGGLNWIVSNENFMKSLKFVDQFKVRASYGQTGFDNLGVRWPYLEQWNYNGRSRLGISGEGAEQSPYTWYSQTVVGNPNVQWEQSEKYNVGVDFEFLKGFIKGKADFFTDNRSKILLANRSDVPTYFGATPPVANLGSVKSSGYELELHLNKSVRNFRFWTDLNMTHTQNKIIDAANPELLPDYQKSEGMQINQAYSYVSRGMYNTWDQLYGSAAHNANDNQKLPSNYYLVDYNGDGIIDARDNIPYGYTGWPANTYNATFGIDWKGFSAFVQFYAVNNVTRQVEFRSLSSQSHTVYQEGEYWSPTNTGANPMPRWLTTPQGYYRGTQYMYDGSYVRLKNAEIAYNFTPEFSRKLGVSGLRIYLNGNNLIAWSKMPDDRESNFAGTGWASQGAYPTVKRFNLGLNLTF
ncbi:SusC/RagA family TonB-linked outer membrane protein [Flectobacillus sp. BAB-3569]|uniref:SusC/RagA family TonB-linked outer membrane protein n=1 Tax=Flectobacillus sp. BAB-3569 TaxID=1509483 RepID=UPI001E64A9DE|nr:SusC/RagA family TonB-linked outer membrane protein [Flectobacillus sp. BAB-3569]